jgi:hypothetical protein
MPTAKSVSPRRWLPAEFLLLIAGIGVSAAFHARADILEHWTTNQITTNSFGLDFVVYGSGRYVALGSYSDGGVILSSSDGIAWTKHVDGGPPAYDGLSYPTGLSFSGGKFFALGGFGKSAVSSNGTNWTQFNHPFPISVLTGGTFANNTYVAVGSDFRLGGGIITSVDGSNWTQRFSVPVNDVASSPSQFVAIGNDDGVLLTSNDALNWTFQSIAGGKQISFLGGRYIVPSAAGTNLFSADGTNWTAASTGLTNRLGKISLSHGVYLARAGNYLATSTNGTNWIQYDFPLPGPTAPDPNMATDGNRLLVVGKSPTGPFYNDGFVYTSDLLADVRMTNSPPPNVVLSGLIGRSYQIESADELPASGAAAWQPRLTLKLPANPYLWTDPAGPPQRYYRAVLLP